MIATPLTVEAILDCESSEVLTALLGQELSRRIPPEIVTLEDLVKVMSRLPVGLRAMAATHKLDVSLALDSLLEHFRNFHSIAYADETLGGLQELEALEFVEPFRMALEVAKANWDLLEIRPPRGYPDLQHQEETHLATLNKEFLSHTQIMWNALARQPTNSLMGFWPVYARKYPERCV